MAEKLNPKDLRSFIDKDMRFKRAEALLNNQWESLLLNDIWGMMVITLADITFAKKLSAANLVITTIDLTTFAGVQAFILSNQTRLSPNVVNALKEPFL
ncbi:hypothetical protein [Leuconostoc rapi]|uniref:hypothetical protein n=1 Tax=Leuconostoc rapi TaxID=1406906 RepID=UPI00195C3AF5|nr:hypothetical protein [Leuconostoc rapi]MBM7436227.1 type IV secretory pathway TrbL component [Leuconostoc rapi]